MPSSAVATILAISRLLRPSRRRSKAKDSRTSKDASTPPATKSQKPSKGSKSGQNVLTENFAKRDLSLSSIVSTSSTSSFYIKGVSIPAAKLAALSTKTATSLITAKAEKPLNPPSSFVLSSDVELFGVVQGKLYKFFGEGRLSGIREMVHVDQAVLLKDLIHGLSESRFGDVKLEKTKITYHPDAVGSKAAGVYLSSEIALDGPLDVVGDALSHVFGLERGRLELSGSVGNDRDWKKQLRPKTFSLKGTLEGVKASKGFVSFTEVSVQIDAERKIRRGTLKRRTSYNINFHFLGKAAIEVPGSVVPMAMKYTLKEEKDGIWTLRLVNDNDWTDVVGFKGLKLSNLQFVATFPVGKTVDEFSFSVESELKFGDKGTLDLKGAINSKEFYVEASVPQCTLDDIRQFYTSITSRQLEPFHHPTSLKGISLRVDKKGLSFSGDAQINDHAVHASIDVKRDGILITGALVEDMHLDKVTVENAELDVFIGRAVKNDTSRESGFSIDGTVNFHNMRIDVAVHMTYNKGEGLQWTVYGELESSEMKLNHLAPEVKDSWLDIEIRQVAFIVSNTDAPDGDYNAFAYPIRKGVQFCATIDKVKQVDHVVGKKVSGLVLRAAWDGDFKFGILLPSPIGLKLGKNVTSGPVEIAIDVGNLELVFSASVNVTPHRQAQPLVFTFGLKASVEKASGFGEMTNYWVNPFGLNEHVKIGPNLALEIGVIYAVLASTGSPSTIGISGGIAIGDVDAQAALVVSANPADELIKASLSELSVTDLIKFASKISDEDITCPPEEILAFRDILFYISSGVSIGTTKYPAGVSFKGEIELLGHKTDLEATVGSTTKISAEFDELRLGPLCISGSQGKRASTNVVLGASKQHVMVDGEVQLGHMLDAGIHGAIDILPKPNLEFAMNYEFADALDIELEVKIIGMVDWKNIHGADFKVHAVLEQDVLEWIVKQIKTFLKAALHLLKRGIEAAHEFVEATHKEIDEAITAASELVKEAKTKWEEKEATVKQALHEITQEFEHGVHALENSISEAKEEFEALLWDTENDIEQTKLDNAATEKEKDVTARTMRRDTSKEMKEQLEEIRKVKHEVKAGYGDSKKHVLQANEGLARAQAHFDECAHAVKSAKKELDAAPFYRRIDRQLHLDNCKEKLREASSQLGHVQHLYETAQKAAGHEDYKTLIQTKVDKKKALLVKKGNIEKAVEESEKDLVAHKATTEAALELKKSKLKQLRIEAKDDGENSNSDQPCSPQSLKLKDSRNELETFKSSKSPELDRARKEHDNLTETSEYKSFQGAKKQLEQAKKAGIEKDLAKHVVSNIADSVSEDKKEKHAGFLEKLENTIDIERIELTGSLRELIEHANPLDAKIQGVIMGKKFDVEIGYGVGNTHGFLKGVWSIIWDTVKSPFEDGEEKVVEVL